MAYLLKILAVSFALVISSSDVAVDALLLSSSFLPRTDSTPSEARPVGEHESVDEPEAVSAPIAPHQETMLDQLREKLYDPNTWVERVLIGYEFEKLGGLEGASKDNIRAAVLGAKELIDAVGVADAVAESAGASKAQIAKWNKAAGYDKRFSDLDKPQQLAFFYWMLTNGEADEEKLIADMTEVVNAVSDQVKKEGKDTLNQLRDAVDQFSNIDLTTLKDRFIDAEQPILPSSETLAGAEDLISELPTDLENCGAGALERVRDLLLPSDAGDGLLDGGGWKLAETFAKAGLKFKLKQLLESDKLNLDHETVHTVHHWLEKLMDQVVDKTGSGLAKMVQSLATGHSWNVAVGVGKGAACTAIAKSAIFWVVALTANGVWCHAKAGHEQSCDDYKETQRRIERREQNGRFVSRNSYCKRGTKLQDRARKAVQKYLKEQKEARERAARLAQKSG